MTSTRKAGDFTGLASDYAANRPDYCPSVLNALIGLFKQSNKELDVVDIGAGTGIWTRMLNQMGFSSVTAVEPNEDMRSHGMKDRQNDKIIWKAGSAERTGLADGCADWITMASSFHWADFNLATQEFHRVLRPGGRFTAIWNPRLIEVNPLLLEIEENLRAIKPDIKRVSSGRSGITETLTDKLWGSPYFHDVVYIEGRHVVKMTPDRYIGAWRSVNDLRVQLGSERFDQFLVFVEEKVRNLKSVEATYITRAWTAQRLP